MAGTLIVKENHDQIYNCSTSFFIVLILALVNSVAASSSYAPVAISLPAFSKECLYYDMVTEDDSLAVGYQVLTGGNFEIDFDITSDGSVITSEKQKYSDFY
ncbi:emp24p/erv25p- protein [Saccharomyces pastorianus]|uniref:Emp24p/erv25p-protein n=1 Tax=Saccharomyces pastorianus TaxID=27292 RepID=A0A6C1DL03_SACPS|nr:emp24p/erv25p- protein [Saccharomyces pastorianus]